jgi:hypothetical protein
MTTTQQKALWDLAQAAYQSGNDQAGERLQKIATEGSIEHGLRRAYTALRDPKQERWMSKAIKIMISC